LEYLRRKFKNLPKFDEYLENLAMERFETVIKPSFSDSPPKKHIIKLRGIPDNDRFRVWKETFVIPQEDLRDKIFKPVLDRIINLVRTQIRLTEARQSIVKTVVLAGGFGDSAYLKEKLAGALGSKVRVLHLKER
jgi:Tfp pilus assembly PilM family ATPase